MERTQETKASPTRCHESEGPLLCIRAFAQCHTASAHEHQMMAMCPASVKKHSRKRLTPLRGHSEIVHDQAHHPERRPAPHLRSDKEIPSQPGALNLRGARHHARAHPARHVRLLICGDCTGGGSPFESCCGRWTPHEDRRVQAE